MGVYDQCAQFITESQCIFFSQNTLKRQHSRYAYESYAQGSGIYKLKNYIQNIKLSRKLSEPFLSSYYFLCSLTVLCVGDFKQTSVKRHEGRVYNFMNCTILCNDQLSVIRIVHVHLGKNTGIKSQVGNDRKCRMSEIALQFLCMSFLIVGLKLK